MRAGGGAERALQGGQRRPGEVAPSSAGTTSRPSGLQRAEASLATNLVLATPTEQVIPCSSSTVARTHSPTWRAPPRRRAAPDTSRNASSSDSGSTSGVTDRNTSITPAEVSAYAAWSGLITTACGQSRRARIIGIALATPKARASYVADSTTPRDPPPPTITGSPRSSGRLRSSTDA